MHWTDEGIILGTRKHGETSLILELMTAAHGRHLGLVRGGRSRRQQPVLQAGNTVAATWRARLDEHLGNFTVEPTLQRAARLMAGAPAMYGLQVVASVLRLLPERDPHPGLYGALVELIDLLDDPAMAAELIVRFELGILGDLGFGLDLTRCAATGTTEGLAYVSPKTGRAVSRAAGAPYHDKLLPLPAFLIDRGRNARPEIADIVHAFRLTGFFLDRHAFEPRGLTASPAREALLALLADGGRNGVGVALAGAS